MGKIRSTSYTFDASAQTIVSTDFSSLEAIQLITNVTDNIIIYNFADPALGGSLSSTTLTLDFDTTTMDDADKLAILMEDGTVEYLQASFTTTSVQAVAITDVGRYRWASVHIVTQGGSSTVTFQGSNDNTNWVSCAFAQMNSTASATVNSTTATGIWHGPMPFRYFRLNVTGIVSGTTAGVCVFSKEPTVMSSYSVVAAQTGTWTVQPGNTANTTAWKVDGSAVTQPISLTTLPSGTNNIGDVDVLTLPALAAGTNGIGKLTANSGVDIGDVDVTSISAGTNAIGNVGLIGRTSGGLSIFRSLDIDETEEDVKTSAGQLFSISAFNRTAAPLYLKFYNATAANVTVGSTTPVMTFVVPGNADSDGAGFVHSTDIGYAFGTAISVACTTGVADADTGAPGANDCVINLGYM